jgi:outer membrane receptor protein involved in Fe transport
VRLVALLLAGVALADLPQSARAEDADDGGREILVTAPTPLSGEGHTVADAAALRASRAQTIGEQLARTAPGVSINEIQGNPLQPDIAYRGFTASPLLGTPQGLSVYLDGVRINQPFGDVVSWDLIPTSAIRTIDLVSGAAPQFGRNSLGGALAVRTKDGRSDPGIEAEVSYGSFDRLNIDGQIGGHADNGLHWFLTGEHFREDGWRDFSQSRATRAFAKLGWSGAGSDVSLSSSFADTDLNGNGLQEMRLLEGDRSSIYTAPDNTRNRSWLVNFNGSHRFSDSLSLSGNVYWRRVETRTFNGDVNDNALGENVYQPSAAERTALTAAGYTGFPLAGETQANTPFPKWRCIANVLLNSEPNEKCNGLANRSATDQDEWGGGLELAVQGALGGIENHLSLGLAYTNSRAHFVQNSQFGYLLPDRTVAAVEGPGAFADGSQDSENAFDARVDLRARTESFGAYVLESAQLTPELRLDLAGRYDRTAIHNRDQITPGGGTGSLDSDPVYERFNPAVALAFQLATGVDLGLSWAQASRAPSAIELGCSDPNSPCRLPSALAGDPPLKQVIARTLEAKAGVSREHWSLSLSAFRTDSSDDILFVTDDPSGFGYFRNFGKTRRQGVEVNASIALGPLLLSANYTFLDATYRSPETVDGAANSANDGPAPGFDGDIAIVPGDRIPLIPRHLFKATVGWRPLGWLSLNADMTAVSGVIARGNENNLHEPDGIYYLGPGRTDAYAVFNLGGEVRPVRHVAVFFMLRNLFDRRYATAAQLGRTAFDSQGNFVARPFAGPVIAGERPLLSSTFYAPGAPRSIEVGASLHF